MSPLASGSTVVGCPGELERGPAISPPLALSPDLVITPADPVLSPGLVLSPGVLVITPAPVITPADLVITHHCANTRGPGVIAKSSVITSFPGVIAGGRLPNGPDRRNSPGTSMH